MFLLNHRLLFPDVEKADDDGLLAVGGDLSPERLLLAYKNGIFPWFNEDSMILWWSPDPRMVLFPNKIKISKSMAQVIKSNKFRITWNTQFEEVVNACSAIKRKGQAGTWITPEMKSAYLKLHQMGIAKSIEVWENDNLVGGLYGIDLGNVFCGESMFSRKSNASKFAFISLAKELQQKEYKLIDCQVYTAHLESLGAEEIPRKQFIKILKG
ncbi:leucyl/phenylalanyl-tRNA--protein transferase [Arenibacter algicola]|mgnify:FL=1|jgi:leucyl/phenylalanyl-tRNA--protein transferase|uniref:Leucyl/phenylalanyl-tRNA--protein transferase n=1 Tax=Arenibacter algicola TaxID=616991 RepID=A0A221USN2_9FLAO|nr:leucyl/phenylalanyl-tRNA--protein transferase [Arenibacter algicola]ASO04354.1 leucyl/phenylalanyl-tRNA--protein transferase [Arenibacter algicola]|tara:strand:- start:76 stop:711 length:636 start_codon:yes stop_codon:yes gene_type:complete